MILAGFRCVFCLLVVFMSGCYEEPKVVLHESHIYKGKRDIHQKDSDARADLLAQRFNQVQLDR